jgi:hypothetical protein
VNLPRGTEVTCEPFNESKMLLKRFDNSIDVAHIEIITCLLHITN